MVHEDDVKFVGHARNPWVEGSAYYTRHNIVMSLEIGDIIKSKGGSWVVKDTFKKGQLPMVMLECLSSKDDDKKKPAIMNSGSTELDDATIIKAAKDK